MFEAFTTAAAGRRGSHDAAGQSILQIPAEHAVLDQHVALRRVALVIDVKRTAPVVDGSVIDHGA